MQYGPNSDTSPVDTIYIHIYIYSFRKIHDCKTLHRSQAFDLMEHVHWKTLAAFPNHFPGERWLLEGDFHSVGAVAPKDLRSFYFILFYIIFLI